MKGNLGTNIMRTMLPALMLIAAACGGEQSVASRSAEAYREAQAKGTAVGGGHEHGGQAGQQTTGEVDHTAHGTAPTGEGAVDHSAHGGGAGAHSGMQHRAPAGGAMDHSAHGAAGGIDHAAMGHGTSAANAHTGHGTTRGAADHSAMGHSASAANAHSGHDTSGGAAAADHSAMGHGSGASTGAHAQHGAARVTPASIPTAPRSNDEMRRMDPSATLQEDAFDAPAPVAVSEAAKAAQGGSHEGHEPRASATSQTKPSAAAVYSCPMHPEVKSDQPGTCPKCGMALVKK